MCCPLCHSATHYEQGYLLDTTSLERLLAIVLNVLATLQVLSGRHANQTLEMAGQMALVSETSEKGDQWDRFAIAQQGFRPRHTHLGLKCVRRHPDLFGEDAIEMIRAEVSNLREVIKRDILREMFHQVIASAFNSLCLPARYRERRMVFGKAGEKYRQ